MTISFPDTRWSLIARVGDGREHAAVLLELYGDSIARYLRLKLSTRVPPADLDDVIQDVAVQLLERPELLSKSVMPAAASTYRFRHWLMATALMLARNPLRARRHDRALAQLPHDAAATEVRRDDDMERAWAASVLDASWRDLRAWALDGTLDPAALAVLDATLVRGVSLRAYAATLPTDGPSLATCQRLQARARAALVQAIAARLRHAGELSADDDAAVACDRLIEALR